MKLLFVYPTKLDHENLPIKYQQAFLPPLSLAILAALTPAHHKVEVINDLVESIDFNKPYDLVAITAMTPQADRAYRIAAEFRSRGVPVVLGGMHPTLLPDEAKQHADSIVIGEVEDLWEEILEDSERSNLKPSYRNAQWPELSQLIIPNWGPFNMSIYPHRLGAKLPLMPIFTTRGCPFGCKFCSVTKVFGKTFRTKPIAHVLAEIDSTPAKQYFFVDDNIICKPDYSRELFKALIDKEIQWFSQASTRLLHHPELIDLAAKSGCVSLFVGVESLSQTNLINISKRFNKVPEYEELIRRMRSAGIAPFLSFIFGFDTDLPQQFQITLDFLRKNKIGYATFWILTPLPGTDLYEEMRQEGRLSNRHWSSYDLTHVVFKTTSMSQEELLKQYWRTYKAFYTWPNLIRNAAYNIGAARNPLQAFLQNIFYQLYFKKKVDSGDHPFSGGIFRVTT